MKRTITCLPYIAILYLCIFFSCKEKERRYIIGVSQCSTDEWRDKMNLEMQNEAALSQNIDLIILSSNDNTEKQIADIRYLIKNKVDLLILTPNEINPITPLIEEIYDSGIPVILVDRKIQSQKYTAFIGADNYQIGKEVGAYAANILQGKGNIVEIKGLSASSPAIERHRGFCDVIKDYPDLKIVFVGDAGWLKEEGKEQMRQALKEIPQIDLVFAQNDRMAKGAFEETVQQSPTNSILFLGIDALPGKGEGIDMVLEDILEATFLYPTGGDKTIQLAINILEKKRFEKENILATSVINKSNAKILKLQTDQIIEQQNKIGVLNQRINEQLTKYIVQRNIMYAISILVIIFLALLVGLFRAYHAKNKLNTKLNSSNQEINKQKEELEKKQALLISLSKQLEEATMAKLSFFTDISHDFRTPLTLISGPVDILLNQTELNTTNYQWLKIIKKNIAILLRLVEQIIEFRKIETNSTELKLSSNDLDGNISDWNLSFSEIALKNNIDFTYQKTDDVNFTCLVDIEKMERIYYNLLSNAFKFTPKNGSIHISLSKTTEQEGDFFCLTISNTGNGLSEKELISIFERFYRIDSHSLGSGIGLALVKALVELHKGNIQATSNNGLTVFSIKIPFLFSEYQPSEHLESRASTNLSFSEIENLDIKDYQPETVVKKDNSYTILIIDDNEELRLYIRSILKSNYHIIEAKDGEEGLKLTYENKIDIIVSDIMMPKMDGVEFCQKVKEDKRVCHIPIILLTAYSIDEQRIKGFESGADAYISKPFNPQILEIRIRKMIENRQKLYTHLNKNILTDDSSIPELNTLDQELIIKFRNKIVERISDIDLNVEDISREFGFSRAQFYRKIKAITNQGPNEFIRTVRLNKSVEILKRGKTVSEVAYEVGFTSPSYFTKCFKEYFKYNPSQIV